jgi:hypothetical protein
MNPHPKKAAATLPLVRCAIYTRKSTEEGLEQEFNSLDAQRESAEAFIRSQVNEGWTCLPQRYDDGGFTGGNMERPALQYHRGCGGGGLFSQQCSDQRRRQRQAAPRQPLVQPFSSFLQATLDQRR